MKKHLMRAALAGMILSSMFTLVTAMPAVASTNLVDLGVSVPGAPTNLTPLTDFQTLQGRPVKIVDYYQDFASGPNFDAADATTLWQQGQTPMIAWEPEDGTLSPTNQPAYTLANLAAGTQDTLISNWANQIKAWGHPISLRFAPEMNGNYNPWSEGVNGNTAGQFVTAWRHVHDLFTAAGANNVSWVWNPNIDYYGSTSLSELYPGDSYVNIVGLDGYNWGTTQPWSSWQSPAQIFGQTVADVRSFTQLPIVIPEVASTEIGGDKAAWITSFFKYIKDTPAITGFVWFNFNKETDWRINSSTAALNAYQAGLADMDTWTYRGGGLYQPLTPSRIADTRPYSAQPYAGRTIGSGGTLNVQVAGAGGVPAGATAVVLNVTATDTSTSSFFTVFPTGTTRPLASSLNFSPGATTPNLVQVGLGSGGQVSIYNNAGSADAVVDVEGYMAPATGSSGFYNALSPARISDTRPGSGEPNAGQTLTAGGHLQVQVDGVGGVPSSGVSAVVLNLTATNTTATSYLTAYPGGTSPPVASNLNVVAGQTVPNRVIVPVGANGQVDLYNHSGNVDTIIDVSGWYTDSSNPAAIGASFLATGPTRLADTRPNSGEPDAGLTLTPGASIKVPVSGTGGVPAAATAVVLNVTVTDTTGNSYLTVYPSGQAQPLASDLNWAAGDTRANLVVVRPGLDGTVTVYNNSFNADVVVDVTGYYG